MRKLIWMSATLLFASVLLFAPLLRALADTAYGTELVVNGGAESGTLGTIQGWTDETGANRWSSSEIYSNWAPPAEGSRYFFLYNPSLDYLAGDMSQWITLSGTEGSGLFASISAGNVSMQFNAALYQKISVDNEVKAVVQQYSAANALLATTNLVSLSAGSGAFSNYNISTQLNPNTRKFKVICSATLTAGGYAQYDKISLKIVDASSGSAPVFGSDFPASGTTDAGVAYTHGFTITDADAGDIDKLSFSAFSTNINIVPAANVSVTGSGTSRTLTITPVSGLSGEADVTVTASDGVRSASATIHLVVSKVITLGTNLVENGNATSSYASWEGSTVNITATGNGFMMISPGTSMYQKLDVSKYSSLINAGVQDFTLSAVFPGSYGMVTAQPYSDIACTTALGSAFMVNTSTQSRTGTLPVGTRGVKITFSNTSTGYNEVIIRNISFVLLNNYPKMTAIAAQSAGLEALTVPVHIYYATASAALTATSGDQTIVANSGIAVSGSGFDRSLTFTPLKEGTVTITATVNDGANTASRSFTVTVHDPATITSVDKPATKYYASGGNLDFTVHFSREVQGGHGSTLPLTIGGHAVNATFLSEGSNTITYRYTLASGDAGAVVLGSAIDDSTSPITDSVGADAQLDFTGGALGITAIPVPEITSNAPLNEAAYGTQITFTCSLTCADTLVGTVQFKADGVNIGSPVALSGNSASYQTAATALDAGSPVITGVYVPSGTTYRFTSLSSGGLTMTITRKSVSITGITAAPKIYDGGTAVTLSGGTLNGVLTGDTVTANYPAAGTAASANQGVQAVSYPTISLSGADSANYALSAQPAVNVTISPKPLTFTATAADKAYDGTTNGTVTGVVFDGLISGETLASGTDYTAAAVFDSAAVGEDIPVTVTVTLLSTTKASSYSLADTTADTQADITQKNLTITGVGTVNRVYDAGTAVGLTGGTLVGVAPADAASVGFTLGSGSVTSANAGTAKPVTTNIVLTGDAADQYTLTQPTALTVNITKAPLALIGAAASDKVYDGNAVANVTSVTISGAVPGETLTFNTDFTATGAFNSADVGEDKPVTVTVTLASTATAANYAIPVNTIGTTASITSGGVTITGVTAVNRDYDGTTTVTLTGGTLVGVKPADAADVGFALNTGTVASADYGSAKAVTTNITLTGAKAGNYTLTQPGGITVDISKATLTITGVGTVNRVYDAGTAVGLTGGTLVGVAPADAASVGFTLGSGSVTSANAGTAKPVTTGIVLTGDAADQYTLTQPTTLTVNITKAPLALTGAAASDKVYDGNAVADVTNVTISGAVPGETLTFNTDFTATGAFNSADVGEDKPVTVTVTLAGTATAANYSIPVNTIGTTASITSGGVTITGVTAVNRDYDGTTTVTLTGGTLVGVKPADAADVGFALNTGTVASADYGSAKAVTTNITLTGSKAGNYTLTQPGGITVDISKATLTITGVGTVNRVYDAGTAVGLTGGTLVGVAPADAASVGFTLGSGSVASANAGTAKPVTTGIVLTGDAADQYTLTQPSALTVNITKAPLALTGAAASDKVYDGNAVADVTDVTISGAVPGETLTFNTDFTATGAFNSADVGEDKPVTVTVTLASTAVAANYAIPVNTIGTTASITSGGVTITGVAAVNRDYDGTTTVTLTGGTLVGVKPADAADVGFALNTGTVASADYGSAKAVTTNITLTGAKAGNYTLTQPGGITVDIARATLTITGAGVQDKPYDTDPSAAVTGVTFGGLAPGETLTIDTDYTATGVFSSADAGTGIPVTVTVTLSGTAVSDNYTLSGTFGTTADIDPAGLTGTVDIDVTNTTGDASLIDEGDVMSVNTANVTVPGTLSFGCQWYRNGSLIPGATATSLAVGSLADDPVGTYYTVEITGTGNYMGTLESGRVTVASAELGGSVSVTGGTQRGDELTLVTDALTPASATYDIQWKREGADIAGATLAAYTIVKDDENKTLTVTVTGYGYFTGSLSADVAVPPSPYVPDEAIVELPDGVTVDLTAGPSLLSAAQMEILYAANADKPVVFNGNGYSITYPAGTMQLWLGTLDLGIRFNAGTGYGIIVSETGDDFVLMLEFAHSGPLPGEAQICIYVGTEYAGQTMRYLYYNPLTKTTELVTLAVVDANGCITVMQDHCSSYGVARLRLPDTGDPSLPALWRTLAAACAAALLALAAVRRRRLPSSSGQR